MQAWLETSPAITAVAITELRTLSWYQNDNLIVLTLNKADITYFELGLTDRLKNQQHRRTNW